MVDFGMMPQSVIKYVLASIAVVLQHLHDKNIIYRNINPSNIIIRNTGYVVITDFSCAKVLDENGRTSTVAGVPYYMAPEVIEQQEYSYTADVWSMGVVLYEMMSGSLPFGDEAADIMEIYESIKNDELNLRKIRNKS
jgi:serine/threonine protein kinase